jgi:hypothetical protein
MTAMADAATREFHVRLSWLAQHVHCSLMEVHLRLHCLAGLLLIAILCVAAVGQDNNAGVSGIAVVASLPRPQSSGPLTPDVELQAPKVSLNASTYEGRMDVVLRAMSAELSEIAEQVRDGKISPAEGDYLYLERYYIALSRFQYLRTLYPRPGEAMQRGEEVPQETTEPQISGETLIVPPRVSSPDIPAEIIAYLELNPPQIAAMQAQIADERKQIQPLLQRLEESRRKLISTKQNGNLDNLKSAATEQSKIMKRLIVANALLETKLYRMLTSEQQRKADELRRQNLTLLKPQFPEW